MSYAVMPLADYDAVCDKIREKAETIDIKFKPTDFGYLASAPFAVENGKAYTFDMELTDSNLFSDFVIENEGWANNFSPWFAESEYPFTFEAKSTRQAVCIYLHSNKGLTPNDIVSATVECNGEIVANFVEPKKIKSGELADTVDRVYEAGIESGEQTEYDRFWDAFQRNGSLVVYENAFGGRGWNAETFRPKYNMQPTTAYMMFRSFEGMLDLVEHLKNLGVTLDFSNCTNFQYFLQWGNITRMGEVDIRQAKGSTTGMFAYALYLHTIDLLKVAETNTTMNIFDMCSALQNITIEGVVAANIGFGGSPMLSDASVDSIIAALQDRNGTSTLTFTVHKDVYARMVASGKDALVTAKNWTLVSA